MASSRIANLELLVAQYASAGKGEHSEEEPRASFRGGGDDQAERGEGSDDARHSTGAARQLQRTTDAEGLRAVHIFTATLTTQLTADMAQPVVGGRRRSQTVRACDAALLQSRIEEVSAECCSDELEEDCQSGLPSTCNSGCANVVLQFWHDCESELDKDFRATFHQFVRQCQDADVARAGFSDAQQLRLTCTDGSATQNCVPDCDETLHGCVRCILPPA
eukprot:SAG31_NODE_1094_length_9945_cov_3.834349_16_plen_220_part_00